MRNWQTTRPEAFAIHCWLEVNAPFVKGQNVVFRQDDALDDVWESTLLPPDNLGPVHVLYRANQVEVLRYWLSLWDGNGLPVVEVVAVISYSDSALLDKVLQAATGDLMEDWTC